MIVMLNAFIEMSVTIFLITYAPTYFNKVLKFDVGLNWSNFVGEI